MLVNRRILVLGLTGALAIPMAAPSLCGPRAYCDGGSEGLGALIGRELRLAPELDAVRYDALAALACALNMDHCRC
jgi:hypothetical protein